MIQIFEMSTWHVPKGIYNLSDSLWFTAVTVTTVGYGDFVPFQDPARAVAVALMFVGENRFRPPPKYTFLHDIDCIST